MLVGVVLGVVIVVTIVTYVVLKAVWLTRTPPAGAVWSGSAAVELPGLRTSPAVADAAPRPGLLANVLLSGATVGGTLVLAADRLTFRPDAVSRLCGATDWELARPQVVAAEASGRHLRLVLADRSMLGFELIATRGLEDALAELDLAG